VLDIDGVHNKTDIFTDAGCNGIDGETAGYKIKCKKYLRDK
jgi:hypothetical protein